MRDDNRDDRRRHEILRLAWEGPRYESKAFKCDRQQLAALIDERFLDARSLVIGNAGIRAVTLVEFATRNPGAVFSGEIYSDEDRFDILIDRVQLPGPLDEAQVADFLSTFRDADEGPAADRDGAHAWFD